MAIVLTPSPPQPVAELPAEDPLYEVVNGVRVEKIVSAYAVWIANELNLSLSPVAKQRGIGTCALEMMFILDADFDLRRRPDLAMVAATKWPVGQPPPPRGDWEMIPDLAVEVLSPGNDFEKMLGKLREYFDYGVTEVWIVAPTERIVLVYRSLDDVKTFRIGQSLTTGLVPGWSIPIESLLPHAAAPAEV
jgi:Uma2 family endonuclease